MSQPFAIRCCTCQSIWEAESLSTLIQCPVCLAMLELDTSLAPAAPFDQSESHDLRWELARQMTIQAIARWRQRLLAEQPQLTDLPHERQQVWWRDERVIWRGIALLGVLTLAFFLAPWPLTLALVIASSYAVIVHSGWKQDDRARQVVALREQTLPLLMDLPRQDFAPGGRFDGTPFDATTWLQSHWSNHRSSDVYQILGWQESLLLEISNEKPTDSHQDARSRYLHETKSLSRDLDR